LKVGYKDLVFYAGKHENEHGNGCKDVNRTDKHGKTMKKLLYLRPIITGNQQMVFELIPGHKNVR
jgi:hypothetical protein